MTGSAKAKGDRAEREAAAVLADLLGVTVRRKLGAGRCDDLGDIDGLDQTALQVADWKDFTRAAVVKAADAETQATRSGVPFSAAMLRIRGGTWRFVLTPEAFCALWREATGPALVEERDRR